MRFETQEINHKKEHGGGCGYASLFTINVGRLLFYLKVHKAAHRIQVCW